MSRLRRPEVRARRPRRDGASSASVVAPETTRDILLGECEVLELLSHLTLLFWAYCCSIVVGHCVLLFVVSVNNKNSVQPPTFGSSSAGKGWGRKVQTASAELCSHARPLKRKLCARPPSQRGINSFRVKLIGAALQQPA